MQLGRLQIFNNWSPALVSDPDSAWLGLEYFCQEGDSLWTLSDSAFSELAITELTEIDLIDPSDVLDYHVVRIPKAYPAYFGAYAHFDHIKAWTHTLSNLFLVGRNGLHRYNNQDHSMLTAMQAVQNIKNGVLSKENIWSINTEEEYHEEKK